MRLFATSLFFFLGITLVAPLSAQVMSEPSEIFVPQDESSKLLREFYKEKRDTPLEDKTKLTIAGDVTFEFDRYHEVVDFKNQRGTGTFFPNDDWWVIAHLLFDYRTDCAWASIKFQYKNRMGKVGGPGGGQFDNLFLERCLIGYRLYSRGDKDWYVELGRQWLFDKFDSAVMFGSTMDGVFTKYTDKVKGLGKFYVQGAFMVIDPAFDQYATCASTGLENIAGSGFYVKGAYINWVHHGLVRNFRKALLPGEQKAVPGDLLWSFRPVQILVGYKLKNLWRCKPLKVYLGYINNLAAFRRPILNNRKENVAGFIGFRIGEAIKKGDWAFRAEYDYVEAQSILPSDNAGIGRGNAQGSVLFLASNPRLARGATNYKGISVDYVRLLTDNLTLGLKYMRATDITPDIGGDALFQRITVKFVYAF